MDYMKSTMTGWESYKVLEKCLQRWHKLTGDEYIGWLSTELDIDTALMNDWANSIEEMVKERNEFGNKKLAVNMRDLPVYRECGCWEKQIEQSKK